MTDCWIIFHSLIQVMLHPWTDMWTEIRNSCKCTNAYNQLTPESTPGSKAMLLVCQVLLQLIWESCRCNPELVGELQNFSHVEHCTCSAYTQPEPYMMPSTLQTNAAPMPLPFWTPFEKLHMPSGIEHNYNFRLQQHDMIKNVFNLASVSLEHPCIEIN